MSLTRITANAVPTGEPTARELPNFIGTPGQISNDFGAENFAKDSDDIGADRRGIESEWLIQPTSIDACYQCPGESRPITRAVHLSRLATHYSGCRECVHRHDAGHIEHQTCALGTGTTTGSGTTSEKSRSRSVVETVERREHRGPANGSVSSLFHAEGLRGVYLNQVNHQTGVRLGEVVAATLWERSPSRRATLQRMDDSRSTNLRRRGTANVLRPEGPVVVLGCDSRSSAPEIVTGVAIGLRRMGCNVIDVGRITRPVLEFTVREIEAKGGVLVTGAGCPTAWTGADLVGEGGEPWSSPGVLRGLQDRWESPVSRPTRQGGSLVPYAAMRPYLGSLLRHFRNCRRLRIGVSIDNPILANAFQELAPQLPVSVSLLDARELSELDARSPYDLACRIAEDGRRLSIWDEQQRPVQTVNWLVRLAEWMLSRSAHRQIVIPASFPVEARGRLRAYGAELVMTDGTEEGMCQNLHRESAPFGADGEGRFWCHENQYQCDGLTTLALLLELLSRSDSPASLWSI